MDAQLEYAIAEVREALKVLPYGEVQKILEPIEAVIDEAIWLNVQRDRAREEIERGKSDVTPTPSAIPNSKEEPHDVF